MGKMGKMAQMMANTDYNYAGGGGNEGVSVCVSVYLCVCVWAYLARSFCHHFLFNLFCCQLQQN